MTPRRPAHIPQRRQIFVGCEGKSEAGYVALLQDFARTANLPIYLNIKELAPGAGDPLARVEMAVRLIKQEASTRVAPSSSFVLLDEDQTVLAPARAETARQLAAQKNITIVWQQPCLEAVLLGTCPAVTHGGRPTRPALALPCRVNGRAMQSRWIAPRWRAASISRRHCEQQVSSLALRPCSARSASSPSGQECT